MDLITLLAVLAGAAGLLTATAGVLLRTRSRDREVRQRLERVAVLLSGEAPAEGPEGEASVFRAVDRDSWFARARSLIEGRYPLLNAGPALLRAVGLGLAAIAAAWFSMRFLKVPVGWWTLLTVGLAGAGAAWYALSWLHARRVTQFVNQLPDMVDQMMRLAVAGVPPVEAIAIVAEDSREPAKPVLRDISDKLAGGLDAEVAVGTVRDRIRVSEFTLFAAIVLLQHRAGGGISNALSNLATTVRERHAAAMKARAATAQTRLTLLILALLPPVVLLVQNFVAPQSVEILFNTETGTALLRWAAGLIVVGLLVVRSMGKRCER